MVKISKFQKYWPFKKKDEFSIPLRQVKGVFVYLLQYLRFGLLIFWVVGEPLTERKPNKDPNRVHKLVWGISKIFIAVFLKNYRVTDFQHISWIAFLVL